MYKSIIASIVFIILAQAVLFPQTKKIQAIKNESYITYQLTHPMHEIEATSKETYCLLEINAAKKEIKKIYVQIPVATFDSKNSNRDSHAMEVIDGITYPNVKFIGTSVSQSGDSVKATGKLTFHGVTKEVYINAVAKWSDKKLWVNGSFNISLTAFNIERPSLLMVPVKDIMRFTFNQVFDY